MATKIKVKARREGFLGGTLRHPGAVFEVELSALQGPKPKDGHWLEVLDPEALAKAQKEAQKPQEIKRKEPSEEKPAAKERKKDEEPDGGGGGGGNSLAGGDLG